MVLAHAVELLDLPQQTVLIGHVAHRSQRRLALTAPRGFYIELRRVHIGGQRHEDLHVGGRGVRLEVGLGLHEVVDGRALARGGDLDPDERTDLCVQTIRHQRELSVGRDEADRFIVVERRQTDALVEVHVFQVDVVAAAALRRLQLAIAHVESHLVVQT